MSKAFYSKWWIVTRSQLAELQKYDAFMRANTKPTGDRVQAAYLVSGLYCKYCMIVQDIMECLDQISQPQKQMTIRKLMDAAVIRLNELKEMLTNMDLSEIHYVDGSLIELKLVPYSVEILNQAVFQSRPEDIQQMWKRIQKGERLFARPEPVTSLPQLTEESKDTIPSADGTEQPADSTEATPEQNLGTEEEVGEKSKKRDAKTVKKFVLEKKELTQEEMEEQKRKERITNAVKLIQIHERARQARLYGFDLALIKKCSEEKSKDKRELKPEERDFAATGFQRLWRGYAARKFMKLREDKRRILIGMTEPSWKSKDEFEKLKRTTEMRRHEVRQKQKEYAKSLIDEKERLLRIVGPGLMEDISDEIREWFYQWYTRARAFDKYPPIETGGTILVVRGETFTPEEWIDEVERKRREMAKDDGKSKEKEKAEKKKKEAEKKKQEEAERKKAAEEKKKSEAKQEFQFKFGDSLGDAKMTEGFAEYEKMWGERKMRDNPNNELYMDVITDEKCYEVQLECRAKVDELMRLELELLEAALAYDKAMAEGKKPKPIKKKKQKGKKGKGKGKKDPTGNRSTEDLFQELVDAGIIHTYPATHLEDFKGDMSYSNWEKRLKDYDPPPTLGDIRQVVALTCILPLAAQSMVRPKSVLIIGHKKCGKHLLANAIFTETKSVLFDLSAPILAGKYQGGAQTKMLVHLVNKMSRLLQPSVIFFDGAEKPFYKKVPKQEKQLEPKKLGKQLFKQIVKTITTDDRVLVLGISNQPWAAAAAGLKKAFERVISIPRSDYGSVYLYWRELLMPYHGVDRDIDLSCLTRLSVTYPLCQLKEVVEEVMTPARIIQLRYNPLRQIELYNLLISSKYAPVTDKEYNKFIKFYNKTTLGKKKAEYMEVADKKREQEAKLAEKEAENAAKKKK